MKRFLSLLISVPLILCVAGCADTAVTESRTPVTINMPTDNTVNGYRTSDYQTSGMPETIQGEDTAVGNIENLPETKYCANKNSKVFHNIDCTSVEKINEKNRVYYSDRNKLIKEGFSPCKRCKP